jgi:cytoskeleton protein RodZ
MVAGYELKDVAAALRIRLIYLEALEEGRFDDLPGMTYAVGFLRSYSKHIGLDPDEMITRLKRETASANAHRDLTFPVPPKEGGKPKPWLILVVLVLAGLAYGGWRVYSTEGQIATDLVADVSTTLTEAAGLSDDNKVMVSIASEEGIAADTSLSDPATAGADASSATDESAVLKPEETASSAASGSNSGTNSLWQEADGAAPENSTSDASVNSVAAAEVAPAAATTNSVNAPQGNTSLWDSARENTPSEPIDVVEPAPSASSQTNPIVGNAQAQELNDAGNSAAFDVASASPETPDVPAYQPSIHGVENTDFRISITATADSWVQIQGPNNELLLTRILRTGDVYQVPDRTGLIMVTGNAGALELRVDGTVVEALGPVGVVRRNVPLDPEALVAGTNANH